MEGLDVVRAILRWAHAVAASAWVGGSIFYLVVLRPSLASAAISNKLLEAAINKGFRGVVHLSIITLIISGVFITIDRASSVHLSTPYFTILALKLAAVAAMLFMARELGTKTGRFLRGQRRQPAAASVSAPERSPQQPGAFRKWLSPSRMVLVLGLCAFFLSMLLADIYENDLRAAA